VSDDELKGVRQAILEAFPDASAPPVRFFGVPLAMKVPENVMTDFGDAPGSRGAPARRPRSEIVLSLLALRREGGLATATAESLAVRVDAPVKDVERALEVLRGFRMIRTWAIIDNSDAVIGMVVAPDRAEAMGAFLRQLFERPVRPPSFGFRAEEIGVPADEIRGQDSADLESKETVREERSSRAGEADDEHIDFWEAVTAADVEHAIDEALVEDRTVTPESGRVLVPVRNVSLGSGLCAAVGGDQSLRDAIEDSYREIGVRDLVARFALTPPDVVIDCCESQSRTSGSWGLGEVQLGNRGYLFAQSDEDEDDDWPILGAWEPADDAAARRACILAVHGREWRSRNWPPVSAREATGDPGLLQEAILRALDADPKWWGHVRGVASEAEDRPETPLPIEAIARRSGATPEAVRRVLGMAPDVPSDEARRIVVALYVHSIATDPFGWLKKWPE
jgi:hypothetical protein